MKRFLISILLLSLLLVTVMAFTAQPVAAAPATIDTGQPSLMATGQINHEVITGSSQSPGTTTNPVATFITAAITGAAGGHFPADISSGLITSVGAQEQHGHYVCMPLAPSSGSFAT